MSTSLRGRSAWISRRRGRAYTLAEVVLVTAIMGVSAAVAVPRYSAATRNFRAAQAAQRVAADLSLARWAARTTSTAAGVTVTFTVASSSYVVPGVPGPTGPASAYAVSLAADPYQATLTSVSFGGGTSVTFDRYGQPSSGGTVVVQVGTATRTVTLDGTAGTATIQ